MIKGVFKYPRIAQPYGFLRHLFNGELFLFEQICQLNLVEFCDLIQVRERVRNHF